LTLINLRTINKRTKGEENNVHLLKGKTVPNTDEESGLGVVENL
jgi:hypothetical protein